MNWDELGIAAAIGAAVLKVSESLVTYLSNRFLLSRRDKIEQEKQAFELYNDLIVKFNDLQKDLIQTREDCYQKQLEMDTRIAAMQEAWEIISKNWNGGYARKKNGRNYSFIHVDLGRRRTWNY